ncbi:uncharacterized protein LOC141623487 isoform X2 [Silene latifolia]|uniref:uncharacterized protein LOC141623487 isoform X2 n=1 Tax=Silene latifolia TaxID=37657 RepID=UPI003D784345
MGKKQMARRTPPKKNMEGVKMAAAMGGKKKSKEQASVVDDIHVQAGPLKVDKKKTIAEECSKELELGQGSKRKTATSAEMEADLSVSEAVAQKKQANAEAAGESEETFTQQLENDPVFYAAFIAMLDEVDTALENVVLPLSFDLGIDDIGVGGEPPARSYELRYTRARDRPPWGPVYNVSKDAAPSPTRAQKPCKKK